MFYCYQLFPPAPFNKNVGARDPPLSASMEMKQTAAAGTDKRLQQGAPWLPGPPVEAGWQLGPVCAVRDIRKWTWWMQTLVTHYVELLYMITSNRNQRPFPMFLSQKDLEPDERGWSCQPSRQPIPGPPDKGALFAGRLVCSSCFC